MIRPLKVVLLVPEYRTPPAPGGGVASVADFFCQACNEHRPEWDLTIVSPRMWHQARESVRLADPRTWLRGPALSDATVNARRVRYVGAWWAELEQSKYRPRAVLDLQLRSADAVVAVAGTPAIFNMASRISAPVIGQVATTSIEERRRDLSELPLTGRIKARINGALTSRMDAKGIQVPQVTLVENFAMMEWAGLRAGGRVELVPPGIDLERFHPAAAGTASGERPYILTVGRLGDPRKDVGTLIRAFAFAVRERQLTHDLVLAGNQPPPATALELARQLGVDDRIQIRTSLNRSELVRAYQNADLFAMSSSEEGLGLVQIEALACGIPVVATRTAGAVFVLDRSPAGVLVDFGPDLYQRLGHEIASLLHSPARYAAAVSATATLRLRFCASTLGQQFIDIVERLARSCPGDS